MYCNQYLKSFIFFGSTLFAFRCPPVSAWTEVKPTYKNKFYDRLVYLKLFVGYGSNNGPSFLKTYLSTACNMAIMHYECAIDCTTHSRNVVNRTSNSEPKPLRKVQKLLEKVKKNRSHENCNHYNQNKGHQCWELNWKRFAQWTYTCPLDYHDSAAGVTNSPFLSFLITAGRPLATFLFVSFERKTTFACWNCIKQSCQATWMSHGIVCFASWGKSCVACAGVIFLSLNMIG